MVHAVACRRAGFTRTQINGLDNGTRREQWMLPTQMTSPTTDLGYYFSGWIWEQTSSNFMKSMLLFFDGLALALPSDLAEELIDRDPILATPLAERGLLTNFVPAATLEAEPAERLALTLTEIVKQYPYWARQRSGELGSFHWGEGRATQATVKALEHALAERGLITPRAVSQLFYMDDDVRLLVLALFARTLRAQLGERGLDLHLTTDSREVLNDLLKPFPHYLYAIHDSRTAADPMNYFVLTHDLADVGADLSAVPLDEVLDFRKENGQHYRAYAKGLREFLVLQQHANPVDRKRLLDERSSEIRDQAADLRHMSRKAFGARIATLLVSLSGAAWTLHTGNPVGALLAGSAAGLQAVPVEGQQVTTYSYIMIARNLGNR